MNSRSSREGVGSPEGWLWYRITRRRLADQRAPQDLARLDDRPIERAAVDLGVVLEQPVARVQVQRPRPLLRVVGLGLAQELLDEARLVQEVAARERLGRQPPRDLDRGDDRRGARRADAALADELRPP